MTRNFFFLGQRNTYRYKLPPRRNRWKSELIRRENGNEKKKRDSTTGHDEKIVMGTHMAVYQLEMVYGFQTIECSNTTARSKGDKC